MKSFSVGILGASGYTGAELLRLLAVHPHFKPSIVTAHSEINKKIGEVYPHLLPYADLSMYGFQESLERLNSCDIVFSCLPHGALMTDAELITPKLVDLSSDFRLKESEEYERWYGQPHKNPASLPSWRYGLPEICRDGLVQTTRIANPGCFATAVILACAPAVKPGLIESGVVVDAISGTSGAGKKPSDLLHFSHEHENIVAYKVGEHQHIGEIEQALNGLGSGRVSVSMTTHLAPMSRGIHAVCSAQLQQPLTIEELRKAYRTFYQDEPFVRIVDASPHTKHVRGSNYVSIFPTIDQRNSRLIVTVVIDNLVKGAAGQALQNANIICGLPETTGLLHPALYP